MVVGPVLDCVNLYIFKYIVHKKRKGTVKPNQSAHCFKFHPTPSLLVMVKSNHWAVVLNFVQHSVDSFEPTSVLVGSKMNLYSIHDA